MLINHVGRGLQIVLEEGDLQDMKSMLDLYIEGAPEAPSKEIFALDAAVVAKMNDNRGESGL